MTDARAALDELLPVGVLQVGGDRRIAAANPAASVILGISPDRLVGRTLMEALLDARLEASLDAIPAGTTATIEARLGRGSARHVAVRAHRADDGTLALVLEDVTEIKRLRQMRTEFIDNLSHELRTPISTVMLLAETLAREARSADVPERVLDRIARIEVETGHLAQMVSELLDLARIEGGTQLRLADEIDLGTLAAASVDRLRLFAERQGVSLLVEVEPGLPRVAGDEGRLGQVFVNLVHNAVKFSPDGGEVRITIRRSTDHEGCAEVRVRDQGIGIAPADRARVFERFYKADRARVRGGGTGLGLAISRHIVEGHGGEIAVASEEGAGSEFRFTVPFALVPAQGRN
jgi:two-component system phosphate regulon sensor histidine kinase PhoR